MGLSVFSLSSMVLSGSGARGGGGGSGFVAMGGGGGILGMSLGSRSPNCLRHAAAVLSARARPGLTLAGVLGAVAGLSLAGLLVAEGALLRSVPSSCG